MIQGETALYIMKIIGGANGYIVNLTFLRTAAQFLQVAVKVLHLCKEVYIEGILVKDTH
jgi:hypothetical protein